MTREEAFKELNDYNILEALSREAYIRSQELGHDNYLDILTLSKPDIEYNRKLNSEGILASVKGIRADNASETRLPRRLSAHMQADRFALSEDRKISVVKHLRYSLDDFHDSEFFELTYLFTGKCAQYFMIDGRSVSVSMNRGDLIIIPPGLQHYTHICDDSLMVNIIVHKQTFRSAFLSQLPKNNIIYRYFTRVLFSESEQSYIHIQDTPSRLSEIILEMYINDNENDSYSARICENLLRIFLLEVLRGNRSTMELASSVSSSDRLMASLLLYIENNYQKTSLAQISENFNYSKTYINKIFKEAMGLTVQQYIKNLRLNEAHKLLENKALTIEEIAEYVGYNDTSYFIEEYKKAFGKTPKAMRKLM